MPASVPTADEFADLAARVAALEAAAPDPAPGPVPDPGPEQPAILPAPTGLVAVADQDARTITLRWDPVPGAETYTIYELTSDVGLAGFRGIVRNESVRGPLGDPREYRWQVSAVVGGVESARTPVVTASIGRPATPAPAPTGPPAAGLLAAVPFDTPAMTGLRTGDSGIRQWSKDGPNTFEVVDFEGQRWGRARITGGPHPADIRAEGIVVRAGTNDTLKLREGDELWFGDTILIGDGFPAVHFNNVLQWKNDGTGSAPLYFGAWDGQLQFRSSVGNRACGPIDAGKPHRYAIGIRFAADGKGWIEAWRDGVQTLARTATSTLHRGKESYPKVGYYRGDEIRGTGQVFHRDYRIGRTKASVE
jgi:hypothetical protein